MTETTTHRGRLPRLRRAHRRARATLSRYRRLFYGAGAASVVLAVLLIFFVLESAQPDPVPLGAGQAGITSRVVALPAMPVTPLPAPQPETTHSDSGEASYYSDELAGQPTASGENFDPAKLTAAHRSLPFGSRVRVTNTRNGESVVVRINDRGPFHRRRVIDLSYAAARQIGLHRSGTAPVRLELLH